MQGNIYSVLYYPHFQPDIRWLKSLLLLTDNVLRIVPKEAVPDDSDEMTELIQEIPGALVSKPPMDVDIEADELTLQRMQKAFKQISEVIYAEGERKIEITLDKNGGISIGGHVFLHHGKVSGRIKEALIEEGMLRPNVERITQNIGIEEYYPIPEPASNLILSHIADKMARRLGLDTVTDEQLYFTTNSLNDLNVAIGEPMGSAEGLLLSAISEILIPDQIEHLDIKTYIDLRESYTDIRFALKRYVTELSSINRLGRIQDISILKDRIRDIAEETKQESDQLMKTKFAKKFNRWTPFAITSLLSVGATIVDPAYGILFSTGSVSIELLKKAFFDQNRRHETDTACQLLANLRKDILSRSTLNDLS